MARFEVFRNPGAYAQTTPFLLDVQTDFLQGLDTRVDIPLRRLDSFPKVKIPHDLMPSFQISGVDCVLETPRWQRFLQEFSSNRSRISPSINP